MITLEDLKNTIDNLIDEGVELDTPIKFDYHTDVKDITLYKMNYMGFEYLEIDVETN